MQDYYKTLGVHRGASNDDIKKAYRKLAMKNHPDRGGDEHKFKEIEEAYRTLSDPEKKRLFDMGVDPNQQHQGFNHHGFEGFQHNFEDIFGHTFGFGFAGNRAPRRNRNTGISVEITLEDVLKGKNFDAEVNANGKSKFININIPPGIENGQQIRYQGMGDDSIPNMRPGDLIVSILIRNHSRFKREGDSLIYDVNISAWDLMLGTTLEIKTLDDRVISINIPEGTQPDTVFSCRGEGLPNVRSKNRGNLLIKLKTIIPKNLSEIQRSKIREIKNGI